MGRFYVAVKYGCTARQAGRATDVDFDDDGVTVTGQSAAPGAKPEQYRAKYLVDAYGFRSPPCRHTKSGPAREAGPLLVCLHGGGMSTAYFHGHAHPDVSLLTLGAQLGYSVLAVDRPGYGHSPPNSPPSTTCSNRR